MGTEGKRAYRSLLEFFEKTGTTQDEFAEQVGVTGPYISQIANGKRQPALDVALRIAELANVPLETLVPDQKAVNQ